MRAAWLILWSALLVAGCGDDSGPTDAGRPDGGPGDDAGGPDAAVPDAGQAEDAGPREDAGPPEAPGWKVTDLYFELTEEDVELQAFVDATRWDTMSITRPDGVELFAIGSGGSIGGQGISEVRIEGHPSHYPVTGEHDPEVDAVGDFLAQFPEGAHVFDGTFVGGGTLTAEAELTHDLPAIAVITSPAAGAEPAVLDPAAAVVSWEPVTTRHGGGRLDVVGYEVIVERPDGFEALWIQLGASTTQVSLPPETLAPDAYYEVEVLAIEASGNRSIASRAFRTSDTATEPPEDPEPGADEWRTTRVFIELTEEDIELQAFADGVRFQDLEIATADGTVVFEAHATRALGAQGLSELKLDGHPSHFPVIGAHDPEIDEPDDFFPTFPAGTFAFRGTAVGGGALGGTATLTHDLPATPEILSPEALGTLPLAAPVIEWAPVTRNHDDSRDLAVVGYEVIVEQTSPERELIARVVPGATRFTIPDEFLLPDTVYVVEVIAIEASDNQSITEQEFVTDSACEPDPDPPGPDDACPEACSGGCADGTCTIECVGFGACADGTITCPPGYACRLLCDGGDSCDSSVIECPETFACSVDCRGGVDACGDIVLECGEQARCELTCDGTPASCEGALVRCGAGACGVSCEGASRPDVLGCDTSCGCRTC